ncbi:non-specific lipid transfer protein GPI-anchored 1-like isoform X2 [Actinidia eriantha]|uniref:non-specific lipid transfer protein GPI-anchored 1-like isoform X2 n=1 Tax=Actinidia eriantha TaxID=165200 RepID=UPI0025890753|nr:non-specific lipid transfer protein GPI-anchored 1-like isoform X2 [Actinidia eriantha]
MRTQSIVHIMIMSLFLGLYSVGATTVGEQCSNDFEKVATCLNYATGKEAAPTKECCTSVTEIRESHPVCLCYIIKKTHDGGDQVKSLGIQEARLLQLPTACKLANASPELLNLPVSSPDYKIFPNISSGPSTTPSTTIPSTTTGTSSPTETTDGSSGPRHGPQLAGLISIAINIFFCAFPLEVVSIF